MLLVGHLSPVTALCTSKLEIEGPVNEESVVLTGSATG